jgi:hypothetical protein
LSDTVGYVGCWMSDTARPGPGRVGSLPYMYDMRGWLRGSFSGKAFCEDFVQFPSGKISVGRLSVYCYL